jgi:large subunit ribosomal protein L13
MKAYATTMAKPQEMVKERKWYVIDAEGMVLGRMATEVAHILRGKHKPIYTPHVDCGDHVIIINADKVRVTGKKEDGKIYWKHTGYPGGKKEISFKHYLEKKPEELVTRAVKGMLPHNRLGRSMIKKLKVYAGNEHPHAAQMPEALELDI